MAEHPDDDRHAWAARVVDPEPGARLLEVGCGHGLTLSALAARLEGGKAIGIDRSAKMVAAAAARNAAALEAGTIELREGRFERLEPAAGAFDAVIAFHVADFWRRPGRLLPRARRLLGAGGALYLFNQLPGWRQRSDPLGFAEQVGEILAGHGLDPAPPLIEPVGGRVAVCVSARRPPEVPPGPL
jgi:SAM-dependent methyltransferase